MGRTKKEKQIINKEKICQNGSVGSVVTYTIQQRAILITVLMPGRLLKIYPKIGCVLPAVQIKTYSISSINDTFIHIFLIIIYVKIVTKKILEALCICCMHGNIFLFWKQCFNEYRAGSEKQTRRYVFESLFQRHQRRKRSPG